MFSHYWSLFSFQRGLLGACASSLSITLPNIMKNGALTLALGERHNMRSTFRVVYIIIPFIK